MDQEINDRDILQAMGVDKNVIIIDKKSKEEIATAMKKLTNLDNPNSVIQVKKWLSDIGIETDFLGKKNVAALKKTVLVDQRDMLSLCQQFVKSNIKKYQSMQNTISLDGMTCGIFE